MLETTTVLKSERNRACGRHRRRHPRCLRPRSCSAGAENRQGRVLSRKRDARTRPLGAYSHHVPDCSDDIDLGAAVDAMAAAGEYCLSTSFCMWCQDAFAWYIFASQNQSLKHGIGRRAAQGDVLGGTALSNPMKSFFGIEHLRLKGKRSNGGYVVNGALPYVSNLGSDHYFGAIFEVDDGGSKFPVMAIVPCAAEGISLAANTKFLALDGTRTYSVQLRDASIPDAWVLADPAQDYVKRIRAGFVLLQAGMAFGLIRDCIKLMRKNREPPRPRQQISRRAARAAGRTANGDGERSRSAVRDAVRDRLRLLARCHRTRLAAGEASVTAAHAAMLHCGAQRLFRQCQGTTPPARGLFRGDRDARNQTIAQNARGHGELSNGPKNAMARNARKASQEPCHASGRTPQLLPGPDVKYRSEG